MKILILSPDWQLPWLKTLPKALTERGHKVYVRENPPNNMTYDVAAHMWAVGTEPGDYAKRNVMFVRSFDFYYNQIKTVKWDKIDHVVAINDFIHGIISQHAKGPCSLIYNHIDCDKWTYKERSHGKNIGMACHGHYKKNLPLALQILLALPEEYELHIAGEIQNPDIPIYLDNISKSMKRKVYLYGHIDQMDLWWEDKNYCLSTSIREGNPNNVIEAMAKGIKPIVHNWPGASGQFDVFNTVDEAIGMINGQYDSAEYRKTALTKYGDGNLEKIINAITGETA